jgi:uncharacterized repeat protein (TIGR01451 family)
MYQKIKPLVQIFSILILTTIMLLLLSIIIGTNTHLPTAAAQEPPKDNLPPFPVSEETLATFGLSASLIQASSLLTSELEITKKTNALSVTSGSAVTFTISITNHGPNPISYTLFYDDFPVEMKDATFVFSPGHDAEPAPPTAYKPLWLFNDPILVNETVFVTVTGILTSATSVTVKNTAMITPVGNYEQNPSDNVSTASVDIVSNNPPVSSKIIYFPIIFKSPPRVTLYSDNFSNSNSGWYKGYSDTNHCYSKYDNGRYRIDLDSTNRSCWRPAPAAANEVYASFQVAAYHSEGHSNASYGIYSNGQGGSAYYLFRIWPNNGCSSGGGWELIRNGSKVLGNSGYCHSAIKRGYGSGVTNILKITHPTNGEISVYVNNVLLGAYPDGSSQLIGSGTGVYVRSANKDIVIKFDDFTVISVP